VRVFESKRLNAVIVKELVVRSDDRGYLFEVLRSDEEAFKKFGQVYVNYTEPGVIKGFHAHEKTEDNFVCLSGRIKLVLVDASTKEHMEIHLGPENQRMVNIPTGIFHGWRAVSSVPACVINVCTEPFNRDNPDETRVPPNHFEWFSWEVINH